MTLDDMLPKLRCPRSATELRRHDAESLVSEAGHAYPIVNGKPVLVRRIESLHTTPPAADLISRNIAEFTAPNWLRPDAVVVHLGCGDVPSSDPRVISTDILPTQAADVVAEAEAMPFKTGSVDYLTSGAVFEHVHDPRASAAEVRRVLKDDGRFYIDTAFMQGYHGYPSHFFNMTPQAVETLVVDDFILDYSGVGVAATCAHLFLEVQHRMLSGMDPADAEDLLDRPLREVVEIFQHDQSRSNPYLTNLSEYVHRALAASFVVVGRKPARYESRSPERREETAHVRRAYYAARMGLIHRHGEATLYGRRCASLGRDAPGCEPLDELLRRHAVQDTSLEGSYEAAIEGLNAEQAGLVRLRDRYLQLL